ncbi:MAG TPA: rRNA maturation RNase YbeY [Thermoleophilaceae bacterium]|nr:rRNA maturation RNase YbeY [Thermoleophilaceae bacterium]
MLAIELEILSGRELEPAGSHGAGPALRRAAPATLEAAGASGEHLAIALVSAAEIQELNRAHRGRDRPTDVLSFPVDPLGGEEGGPRELGDVVICAQHAEDLPRAAVHGVLHLLGHDHERDGGEMLALEDRIVAELGL